MEYINEEEKNNWSLNKARINWIIAKSTKRGSYLRLIFLNIKKNSNYDKIFKWIS